jgi:hypothetical protein
VKDIHTYLKPYLFENHVSLFNLKKHIHQQDIFRRQNMSKSSNSQKSDEEEENLTPPPEAEDSVLNESESKDGDQESVEDLINVIPRSLNKFSQDERTSSSTWVAALEWVLSQNTSKQVALSDFMEPGDFFEKIHRPVYSNELFE